MDDDLINALFKILDPDPRIDFVLIFGSVARDEVRETSDLDLAIGLTSPLPDPLQFRLDLMAKLSSLHSRIDVVLTQDASPSLAFRIARDGQLVFARTPTALTNFKARAYSMYPDWKRLMSIHERALLDRIDGGTYGR